MTTPVGGPESTPPKEPLPSSTKSSGQPNPLSSSDQKDAFLLNSPFAKMFTATGAQPSVKEIHAIINGILKQQISEIKKQDAKWKKAMRKMKKAIEGND